MIVSNIIQNEIYFFSDLKQGERVYNYFFYLFKLYKYNIFYVYNIIAITQRCFVYMGCILKIKLNDEDYENYDEVLFVSFGLIPP